MGTLFQGVQWVAPTDLGISQLYLNKSKLENIKKWFDPNRMDLCQPLPVHDFGDSPANIDRRLQPGLLQLTSTKPKYPLFMIRMTS